MNYKPWYTPQQNLYVGKRERENQIIKDSQSKNINITENQNNAIMKNFKDYDVNQSKKYVSYFIEKIECAFKLFEEKKYKEYQSLYKDIKEELKIDLTALSKLKDENEVINRYLYHAVHEAWLHATERTNSIQYQAIYSCLYDISYYLRYYFQD